MEKVKESKDYTIFKKRSGRHAVKAAAGKWVNGEEKINILVKEGIIAKMNPAKPKEEAPAAEAAPAEDTAEEKPAE